MTIKSILVPVSDAGAAEPALSTAFAVAARFAAHVEALHVRLDPTNAVPLVGEGMSGTMVEEMMAMSEKAAKDRAVQARIAFEQSRDLAGIAETDAPVSGASGASVAWVEDIGREEEAVALKGRVADLIVLGKPRSDRETPSALTLNAALMDSGRPILLAAGEAQPGILGRNVAIAWNGSAEASRAVANALPFLKGADVVHILAATEDEARRTVNSADLARYLGWHGITTQSHGFNPHGGATGAAVLSEAQARGADLLVMGAYTHSRWRQLIMGGVTRHVLDHARMPVLLCH